MATVRFSFYLSNMAKEKTMNSSISLRVCR
jgi:hypothetical protein